MAEQAATGKKKADKAATGKATTAKAVQRGKQTVKAAPPLPEKPKQSRKKYYRQHQEQGVLVCREAGEAKDTVKVTYQGWLLQGSPATIFAHAGLGERWEQLQDVAMTKTKSGAYEATLLAGSKVVFNICFRDEEQRWDNNGHGNYVFSLD